MNRRFTPENISELKENEVFVFGSNMAGNHAGGAAALAVEKFGAIPGQAEGLQGKSYAIPTLDRNMKKLPLEEIRKAVERLYEFADENADLDLIVTKIGCGIAGFSVEEIAGIFKAYDFTPFNIILPMEFSKIRGVKSFEKGMVCRDFQYAENSDFECDEAVVCRNGFHFCENPIEALRYHNKEVAEVVGEGEFSTGNNGSKIAVTRLHIGMKIDIPTLVQMGLDFSYKRLSFLQKRRNNVIKKSSDSQDDSILAARNDSTLTAQDDSTLTALDDSTLAALDYSTLAARNDSTLAAQDCSTLAARNDSTLAARSCSTLAARNDSTLAARSCSTLAVGNKNIIVCHTDNTVYMNGIDNIAVGANETKMKGKKGNVMCFVEYVDGHIAHTGMFIVDGENVKEDTFYKFIGGQLVECEGE